MYVGHLRKGRVLAILPLRLLKLELYKRLSKEIMPKNGETNAQGCAYGREQAIHPSRTTISADCRGVQFVNPSLRSSAEVTRFTIGRERWRTDIDRVANEKGQQ